MKELHVDLLGSLRMRRAGGAEIRVTSRKAQAVLACLALQPGTAYSRDLLSALLWEDSDTELARASLRQAVAALRRALPEDLAHVLQADAQSIALDGRLVSSDVARLRAMLRDGSPGTLAEAAERYVGTLLEGFDARSSAFEQWLDERRREVRREQLQTLERLAAQSGVLGDAGQRLLALERLTALEPTNECAQRELIDLLAATGRYTDALRQYRVCRDALRRELDVAPEPATEALHGEVLRRRRAAQPEAADPNDDSSTGRASAAIAAAHDHATPSQTVTLREAIVLAVRLCDERDEDPEALRDRWVAVERHVRDVVGGHGGLAAASGEREATAVFGVSTASGHELRHAAHAALALIAPAAGDATARLALGLARGQVLPAAREQPFPLTGRPVSLARSLAARARPGELLAARDVAHELELTHELVPAPPVGDSMAAAMRIVRERAVQPSGRQLAGRRAELAMLTTLLERVMSARRGRTVIVRGDPGIGKSALLETLGEVATREGAAVHVVRALDFGQTTRERPVPAMAARLLGTTTDAVDAERRAAIEAAIAAGALNSADAALAQDLINVDPGQGTASALQSIDNTARERGRTRVLHRLLEAAARRQALLVIVEDVHWADAIEVAHLADLAAAAAALPVLLALSTRADGDPISAAWRARARGCPVTTLDLAPLADDEARELAARFGDLPAAVVERCIETAAGNPLFLEQLLRAAQLGQPELPGSVRSLLLARIERLDPAEQRALHAAAVLGSHFTVDTLRHLLGEPGFDAARLERSGMVAIEGNDCRFAHALIRDAVYESLLRSVRRDWHRRAAHWYEARDFGLQADHLAAAGDPSATAAYLRAASQERQACRLDQALTHAVRARETAVHASELCDACSALGEVSLAKGRTDDAITAYRESIDLAASGAARARAWLGLAASLRIGDRHDEALAALEHAEQGAAAEPDAKLLAQLWTLRGNLHFPRGEIDACLEAHLRAREYAEQAGSIEGIARALGGLGDAQYQRGKMRTARRLFAECVALCEQHSLTGLRLAYLPMVAVTAAYMGELDNAIELADAAAQTAHEIGDPRSELLGRSIRANVGLSRAEYTEAHAASARSGALARDIGAKRFEAEAMILQGLALRGLGRIDEARAILARGADLAREVCPTYCGPWAYAALALVTPESERSKALLDEGEQLLARGCVSHNHLDYRPIAIDVSLRDGDIAGALRHADELERYTCDEPLAPASMIVERARLLVRLREDGEPRPAADALRGVLEKARTLQFHGAAAALEAALAEA